MRVLIIGDPLPGLKPDYDTSLCMAREALRRGHHVDWAEPQDLLLSGMRLLCGGKSLKPFEFGVLPEPGWEFSGKPVADYDTIWIRKDPPFDMSYVSLCWLLGLEAKRTFFVNGPDLLLRYHEKMLPLEGVAQGFLKDADVVPTWMPAGERLLPQPDAGSLNGDWITKPWLGHGGRGVTRWTSLDEALRNIPRGQKALLLYQRYQEDLVEHGDRRVFVLDGKVIGHFARFPAPGSVKANLAAGGTARMTAMTPKQKDLADRAAKFLKQTGIHLAGLDMIGDRINEINITSPTGFEVLKKLRREVMPSPEGLGDLPPPEALYLDFVEKKVAE